MIKASEVPPVALAGFRQLVAAVALSPIFLYQVRKHGKAYTRAHLKGTLLPGFLLGIHFITWIIGARLTPAANSNLIVNLVPIVMPFYMFFMIHEKITRTEIVATAIALSGMLLLTSADFNLSGEYFRGDLICFLSMLFFSGYLALSRKNRHYPSVWLYVAPVYAIGGIFCVTVSLFVEKGETFQAYSLREIILVLGLGIIPTVIGHSILNISMRHLRGQVVSVLNLLQFVFAGILAWFFFREIPANLFYPASILVATSCIMIAREDRAHRRREREASTSPD